MKPWIKEYQPKTLKDVQGQDSAVKQLTDFVDNFKKQKKKAAMLYGPSGSGKTCAVYALANDRQVELIEVNASDSRNEEHINTLVGGAIQQQSLFFKSKVVLVDEIDGLSGRKDRGGIGAISKLIAKTSFPMILVTTNPWEQKLRSLRTKCMLVEFHTLNYLSVAKALEHICDCEKIKCQPELLKSLARRSGGDLRAAVNDLQILTKGKDTFGKEELDELSQRNQMDTVLQALMKVFKTTHSNVALGAFDNVDEDIDKCILWIDENLPKEYTKPKDLAEAYDKLSRVDVFRGRIRRWQHWRFLSYMNQLLTAGIAVSKDEKYHSFTRYTPTTRILKLWQAKMKFQKRREIAAKIAEQTHTSVKEVLQTTLPYIRLIFKKNKEMRDSITEQLDLDKDEVSWLKK